MANDKIKQIIGTTSQSFTGLTVGTVVDTNDPQQNGRLRVIVPKYGDSPTSDILTLPWAIYVSPFGGTVDFGTRGPIGQVTEEGDSLISSSKGTTAYGMWAIPKIGAQVLVACIDDDPLYRVWIGCIYQPFSPHTMPHGRYTHKKDGKPEGPLTSSENPVNPLYKNLERQFGVDKTNNHEWRTRGADYAVSGITNPAVLPRLTQTTITDDADVSHDGRNHRQGYQLSRQFPDADTRREFPDKNYDSHVYSVTTPAFHAFAMDDRPENTRIRLRSSGGHQIILDDTNERIYISTAGGETWFELDQVGNIDMYASRRFSLHAEKDINFTAGESIRFHAGKGIHAYAQEEIRMHAMQDIHVKTEQNIRMHTVESIYVQSDVDTHLDIDGILYIDTASDLNIKSGAGINIESTSTTNVKSGGTLNTEASSTLNIKAGSSVLINSSSSVELLASGALKLQGASIGMQEGAASAGSASSATGATSPTEQLAFWTNRVPDHEPWARVVMNSPDINLDHTPQFSYDSDNVGKIEGTDELKRGLFWRR